MRTFLTIMILVGVASGCGSSSPSGPDATLGPGTSITGTIGSLGVAQPTLSSLMISNSGETLIYLSSGALTCDQLTVSRWLGGTAAGTQVVELVFHGTAKVGLLAVPPAEVNAAAGGKSSANEISADSGAISLEQADPTGMVAGSFNAKYGSNKVSGTFHATFCPNGQGY
jgi:hypothetical protein